MTNARVQSISPNDPNALRKVIEALEVSEGIRGKPDDRKPTVKEVREMVSGTTGISGEFNRAGSIGGGSSPSTPVGLFTKAFTGVLVVGWDWPSYSGHGGSEVFRSSTDQLADAVLVGHTSSNYFIDLNVPDYNTYYYFVRHKKSVNLGSGTGPYANVVQGTVSVPKALPEIKSGVLSSLSPVTISLGASSADRKISIEVSATFYSTIDYDEVGAALLVETGNAATLKIKNGTSIVASVTPEKIQTSHADANGQEKYLYILNRFVSETVPAGLLEYTLIPARLFPSNSEPFNIFYSITAL